MPRILYLHIGTHRTATSSIQKFMHENFQPLMRAGCLYPMRVPRHNRMMSAIFDGRQDVHELSAMLTRLADEKPHDIRAIALSDEDVAQHDDLSPLLPFTDHFDVRIVYAMRRQDLWLESWFFQNVKWQWTPLLSHCCFDEMLALREHFHWIRYDSFLAQLETLFGAEALRPWVFEDHAMPGGPVREFCRQIGLADMEGTTQPPRVNRSMSAQMTEFARQLPLDAFDLTARDLLCRAMETIDPGPPGERVMPPAQRREILAEYEAGNAAVARRYFDRETLFLDPVPDEDTPLGQLALPEDSAELMRRFIAPLLEQLAETATLRKGTE
ncbi:hypothetical protein [Salipiger aestuarii]|uniref:hypothetical protein n=1 Tax=Salipiger aestuarii TaxID=568098 RepID=UPI00123878D9|nr:hypothetical protein [Salipiger aestuarii]KAA8610005.1 hypothetical protein AL037_14205 [Salipiger aestuarii]